MELPKRKPNRLPGYDYSRPGCYFITICTQEKRHVLGRVVGGDVLIAPRVVLSDAGRVVEEVISTMPCVEKYVIMPNHVHLLLRIPEGAAGPVRTPAPTEGAAGPAGTPAPTESMAGPVGPPAPTEGMAGPAGTESMSVPQLTGYLKRRVTRLLGRPVWQRSYYDHVVRTQADYLRIWDYIDTNPAKWREDCYFTETEEI